MDTKEKEIKEAIRLTMYGDLMPIVERKKAYKKVDEIKAKYGLENFRQYGHLTKQIMSEKR